MGKIRPFSERQQQPVEFHYPTGTTQQFRLMDEVDCPETHPDGDYHYLLQLLSDKDGDQHIRMTYYRRPPGGGEADWHFGGQYSITTGRSIWVKLFAKALKKDWFQNIVDEASGIR